MHTYQQQIKAFEDYIVKIEAYGKLVHAIAIEIKHHLQHHTPLRKGVLELFDKPNNKEFLYRAMVMLKEKSEQIMASAESLKTELGDKQVAIGISVTHALNWPNNIMRNLEEGAIINPEYEHSEVLPYPSIFIAEEKDRLSTLFPFDPEGPLNTPQELAFANYLRTSHNPWEK